MRYETMRPHQIREAVALNLPVLWPLGVMEYHGEHLPLGMDMLAVSRAIDRLETEVPMVVLPAFPFGAASLAVAAPKGNGTLHVGAEVLVPLARAMFASLLRVGFRNIHAVIHHQTEDFAQGMPTDLAFRLAAREATFAELAAEKGEGWWGDEAMRRHYDNGGVDPFSWIRVHPLVPPGGNGRYVFDHAGEGETGLMLALAPETVEWGRIGERHHWYTETARHATLAKGAAAVEIILQHLRQAIGADS